MRASPLAPPRRSLEILIIAIAVASALMAPRVASAQEGVSPATSTSSAVQDLPLTTELRARYVGVYSVAFPEPDGRTGTLRLYAEGDALMGRIDDGSPTRLLYQGNDTFRPEVAVDDVVTFTVEGSRATRISVVTPIGSFAGVRQAEDGVPVTGR